MTTAPLAPAADDDQVASLRTALELVEAHTKIATSQAFGEAERVWKKISLFPPAKVVFSATKVADKFFEEDNDSSEMEEIINKYEWLYREMKECREYPCCRGDALGKHLSSSYIISKLKPLKQSMDHKKRKPNKLSEHSDLIEVLLQYTDVDASDGDWNEWDEMSVWINTTAAQNPLLASIVDPVFLIIRGNAGTPAPGWIQAEMQRIPVGRNAGGLSLAATPANTQVRQAPGQPRIPDVYRLSDLADARIVRNVLHAHANRLGLPALQILRLNVPAAGFEWL